MPPKHSIKLKKQTNATKDKSNTIKFKAPVAKPKKKTKTGNTPPKISAAKVINNRSKNNSKTNKKSGSSTETTSATNKATKISRKRKNNKSSLSSNNNNVGKTNKRVKITVPSSKQNSNAEVSDFNENNDDEEEDAEANDWFGDDSDDDKSDDDDEEDFGEEDEDDVDSRFEFVSESDRRAFKAFYDDLTPDQQRRYESFRRSRLSRRRVKKIVEDVLRKRETVINSKFGLDSIRGSNSSNSKNKNVLVDDASLVIIGGMAKMFVGDIVEHARVIMENKREKGPICPRHLREAYRHLKRLGELPGATRFKTLRR